MPRPAPKPGPSAAATAFDVVVIGASAGGLSAVGQVLQTLPPDFPAAVIVVQHLLPDRPSYSVQLFAGHTQLSIKEAEEGDRLRPGTIYVAPPDSHLLLDKGAVKLGHGAQVRFSRPSIDVTFESAAAAYGARCIGVV